MRLDWLFLLLLLGVTTLPAFLLSYFLVGWVRRNAARLGLMDMPGERKVHMVPIPRGGGIGIACGVIGTFFAGICGVCAVNAGVFEDIVPESVRIYIPGLMSRLSDFSILLLGGVCLATLGAMDDRFGLSWKLRILIEFAVAYFVVYWQDLQFSLFIDIPWLATLIGVFWIVMLVNSFNMMDNMDALSAGVACIICIMLAFVLLVGSPDSGRSPQIFVASMVLALLGGLLGFLRYNWPPATIFMGDAGSYFVGYWIAICTMLSTYVDSRGDRPHAVLAPLCLLAIPIYDTLSVVMIRLRDGRSPFQADKKHFSHRLVEMGMSKQQAVMAIYLATLTCSLGALLLPRTDLVGAAIILAIVVCMLLLVGTIEGLIRRQSQSKSEPESKNSIVLSPSNSQIKARSEDQHEG
ncbi:MAG: undecaprenyl/decaprenyl-phosphate alpha-N-acetylglucosaminyl 1-phosphate transferase [Pirellula sp.]|nr:undecaprenyl/decaprenyl-phosphate alpha-N-acetylglucosaminyl 1-phosphate transferase [Pirellula sp.]